MASVKLMENAMADPMGVDFRTLTLLARVHDLRSFTKAAEELGVNQSAVSYTVEKLRGVFQDPLFVRQGRSILPTPRCEEIVQEANRLIGDFRRLTVPSQFDPGTVKRKITIACNYYERVLWVPHIVRAVRAEAPGLELEIVDASDIGHERLLRNEAEMLIGPFQRETPAFYSRRLYHEDYICLMDAGHPAAGAPLDLKTYLGLNHVLVTYGGRWTSRYLHDLKDMGHSLQVGLRVPSPAGIAELVVASDLVATVPRRLAKVLGDAVHVADCPVRTEITIEVVWTERNHRSAHHVWLRDLIHRVVSQVA
jgi:DNA-binding transcriptional LysR family regulator